LTDGCFLGILELQIIKFTLNIEVSRKFKCYSCKLKLFSILNTEIKTLNINCRRLKAKFIFHTEFNYFRNWNMKKVTLFTNLVFIAISISFEFMFNSKTFCKQQFCNKMKIYCKCQEKFVYPKHNFNRVKIYLRTIYRIEFWWIYCIIIYWNYRFNTNCAKSFKL
jgi:hypothetical protein